MFNRLTDIIKCKLKNCGILFDIERDYVEIVDEAKDRDQNSKKTLPKRKR